MGEKVKMVQESILAVGSSKRADRALHGRRPHEGAGYAAGDIGRFPNPVSVEERSPCIRWLHLSGPNEDANQVARASSLPPLARQRRGSTANWLRDISGNS